MGAAADLTMCDYFCFFSLSFVRSREREIIKMDIESIQQERESEVASPANCCWHLVFKDITYKKKN